MTAALTADTSVTVAALTSSLPAHAITYAALEGRELRLVDHVLLETYSVLTRLPAIRLPQELAAELLRRRFPPRCSASRPISGHAWSTGWPWPE